ncbi:hypothetical protein DFH07DRAFT_771522 [Mycena maculata]|uniref:Uncharacterized protein n=1 Tax=Mycena maculata TaxID=230809 RepID=A0AAD7JBL9_9AGAR|nr:hypothetical protein DFH07DRAFT_771522 [Mycena maculata]
MNNNNSRGRSSVVCEVGPGSSGTDLAAEAEANAEVGFQSLNDVRFDTAGFNINGNGNVLIKGFNVNGDALMSFNVNETCGGHILPRKVEVSYIIIAGGQVAGLQGQQYSGLYIIAVAAWPETAWLGTSYGSAARNQPPAGHSTTKKDVHEESATHRSLFLLLPPPHQPKMSTLSQIHTFLQHYFGDALSRLFAMLYRDHATKSDVADDIIGNDLVTDIQSREITHTESGVPVSTESEDVAIALVEPSASELLSAAVAANLVLPSLPSILKNPERRAPIVVQDVAPQNFGPPSTVYHDRRLPFGCITNIPGEVVKASKAKKKVTKVINWSLPTGASRGGRSRVKRSHLMPALDDSPPPVTVLVSRAGPETDSVVLVDPRQFPAPGSPQWNNTKTTLLAYVRNWTEQVKASRRHSAPLPLPVVPPVPEAISKHPNAKRYSSPPVLVASSKAPRLGLEDVLCVLIQDAKDTIAALDVAETGEGTQIVAVGSLHEIIVEETISIGSRGTDQCFQNDATLPTHVVCSVPTPDLVASISASRSMAALSSASSRSISDLLDTFDVALASPRWRRLLSRAADITRRNDSIV